MNCKAVLPAWVLASALVVQVEVGRCSTPLTLGINGSGPRVNLSWPSTIDVPSQGTVFPEYTIERSADLQHWEPIGGKVRGLSGASGPLLRLSLDALPGPNFYRVAANPSSQTAHQTGSGGAEVFGYGTQFTTRVSDADWKANLRAGQKPPSPDWTRSYLVPGPFTVPPGYY